MNGHRHLRRAARPAAALAALACGVAGFGAAAGASPGQNESFRIVGNGTTATVYAHGAFTRTGADTERNSSDALRFGNGKLIIAHPQSAVTSETDNFDPTTCTYTFTQMGTYTLKYGTGVYAGVSGGGRYTATGVGTLARNADGSCNQDAQPVAQRVEVHAHGTIRLASAS